METVRFWYTFEDETGDMPTHDTDMSIRRESGLMVDDVCETFLTFMVAAGYSEESVIKYFKSC